MKKNVAVIMGGYSSERLISLKSGGVVCRALDKNKYNVYQINAQLKYMGKNEIRFRL